MRHPEERNYGAVRVAHDTVTHAAQSAAREVTATRTRLRIVFDPQSSNGLGPPYAPTDHRAISANTPQPRY
jgi:hypothetical protein